jgi:hypothetical protein
MVGEIRDGETAQYAIQAALKRPAPSSWVEQADLDEVAATMG